MFDEGLSRCFMPWGINYGLSSMGSMMHCIFLLLYNNAINFLGFLGIYVYNNTSFWPKLSVYICIIIPQ